PALVLALFALLPSAPVVGQPEKAPSPKAPADPLEGPPQVTAKAWVAADAKVLDEVVTYSERAAKTPGSSAKLAAGEKVPVKELLYGLLLPSGNDAAVALAEHFGARFGAAADGDGL